jgi:RND family efflux transporter MFP subunit
MTQDMERTLTASGSVAAWQEMFLGVELTGIRVAEVLVEVGDKVRAGQPLLRLDTRTLEVQARQADASVAQARASLDLAKANAERGATLVKDGLISSSNADELRATLAGAQAKLATAEADREAARLRLGFATLRAPDDGVISARSVQPGQIVSSGTDLLRLIREGRLEWRAELTEADLGRVKAGTRVELKGPAGQRVLGQVRTVSPSVNPETRTGMLYADLPEPGDLRAGMFAQGQILLGNAPATVLPREAVVFRDGFAYVFVARAETGPAAATRSGDNAAFNVEQRRITIGGQRGEFTEVQSGLKPDERVVVRGAGFLSDGDLVREVAGGKPALAQEKAP